MAAMQARAVSAVRRRDAAVEAEHGAGRCGWRSPTATSSRPILADALGMHLDLFQRIHVDPASVSIVRYTRSRPYVLPTNTHEGDLAWLARRRHAAGQPRTRRSAVARAGGPLEPPRVDDMAPLVHGFDPPERFVAGTVGAPGQRTFFLQARTGARVVSVALEKQQVAALAERIDELLDELMKSDTREVVPAVAPPKLDDAEPLEQPIVEEFRAGTMKIEWRARSSASRVHRK